MGCDGALKCNNNRESFDSASFKMRSTFFVVGGSLANGKLRPRTPLARSQLSEEISPKPVSGSLPVC